MDRKVARPDAGFKRELRLALKHLYDPTVLRQSALVEILTAEQRERAVTSLRRALIQAIESLRPDAETPPQANAWRVYQVISQRYVEQFDQAAIARNLALSTRQLRRLHLVGLQALGDYLWDRYGLAEHRLLPRTPAPPPASDVDGASPGTPTLEEELDWLKESYPHERVHIAHLIQAVLTLIAPLRDGLNVRVECAGVEDTPDLVVQPTTLRQALVSVLTVAIRSVPEGEVHIGVEAHPKQVCLCIRTEGRVHTVIPRRREASEKLEMARQLIALSGGSLELASEEPAREPFIATLRIPAQEQLRVLVIEDNADTLSLLERYLAGTRFRFTGVQDPGKALAVAEKAAPHIIMLDIMLPGIDGWEILQRLREHPRTRGVPVIVSTILPQDDLAQALGASALMRKPVSRAALLSALDRQADLLSRGLR